MYTIYHTLVDFVFSKCIRKLVPLFGLFLALLLIQTSGYSQSRPSVPFDIEFAGITVHLTQPNRLKVQKEIEALYSDRASLDAYLHTNRQLRTILKPLLAEADMPDDFLYAAYPFAESDTNGYWGLTAPKGRQLELVIDQAVDERFHPLISTEAALKNLAYWHKVHNNYVVALLYFLNRDHELPEPERVNASYVLPNERNSALFWKVLARKLVADQQEVFRTTSEPFLLFEYKQAEGKTLPAIARQLEVDAAQVESFSHWLKAYRIPNDRPYSVLVQLTPDEFAQVNKRLDSHPKPGKELPSDVGFPVLVRSSERGEGLRVPAVYYQINGRRGIQAQNCENIIVLAFYGKVSIKAFIKYNDFSHTDVIHPGEVYYLEPKSTRARVPFHIVQKDQTLRFISALYGVRLKSLEKYNHITARQRLQTGRVLWLQRKCPPGKAFEYIRQQEDKPRKESVDEPIVAKRNLATNPSSFTDKVKDSLVISTADTLVPEPEPKTTVAVPHESSPEKTPEPDTAYIGYVSLRYHQVVKGETYQSIARKYSISVKQLYDWNSRSDWDLLKVGDKLLIKQISPVLPAQKTSPPIKGSTPDIRLSELDIYQELSYHTVKPGQTLYRIALINKVSVADLMRWNKLTTNAIEVGQQLVIRK